MSRCSDNWLFKDKSVICSPESVCNEKKTLTATGERILKTKMIQLQTVFCL